MADLGAEDLVPPRRLNELARYGMSADVAQIRRHGDGRRLATLLATVRLLEAKSIDDTLELLDLLMATELLNKAQTAANKEKIRKHPKLAKASARLAVAVEALFESDGWGGPDEVIVGTVWEAIEAVVSRAELRAALVLVNGNVPPADAADPDDWRKELLGRFTTVSGFLKVLPKVIDFGANAEGAAVLAAMEMIPDVIAYRSRLTAPLIPVRMIDADVVNGPWKRLVFGHPAHGRAVGVGALDDAAGAAAVGTGGVEHVGEVLGAAAVLIGSFGQAFDDLRCERGVQPVAQRCLGQALDMPDADVTGNGHHLRHREGHHRGRLRLSGQPDRGAAGGHAGVPVAVVVGHASRLDGVDGFDHRTQRAARHAAATDDHVGGDDLFDRFKAVGQDVGHEVHRDAAVVGSGYDADPGVLRLGGEGVEDLLDVELLA